MDLVLVVVALAAVAINAFFVAAEFAIVRVRVTRIEELVQRGVRRAAAARLTPRCTRSSMRVTRTRTIANSAATKNALIPTMTSATTTRAASISAGV